VAVGQAGWSAGWSVQRRVGAAAGGRTAATGRRARGGRWPTGCIKEEEKAAVRPVGRKKKREKNNIQKICPFAVSFCVSILCDAFLTRILRLQVELNLQMGF
jgi:hypothetical protein